MPAELEIVSPVPEWCYPAIWKLFQDFPREMIDSHSPKDIEAFVSKARQDRGSGGKGYVVLREQTPLGAVWFDPIGDEMCIGHLVFERKAITGLEKMKVSRDAVASIFKEGFRKIVWVFFADNRGFRVFLKRLGAKHEGLFKDHLRRDGEWVDAEVMASFPQEVG